MRTLSRLRQLPGQSFVATGVMLALVSGFIPLMALVEPAQALGENYYDDTVAGECDLYGSGDGAAICDSASVRLVVGETRFVRKSYVHLRAYFKSDSGKVTVYHKNWCPGSNGDYVQSGDNYDGNMPPGGTEITAIRVGLPGNYLSGQDGVYRTTSAASCTANAEFYVGPGRTNPAPGLPGIYYTEILISNIPQGNGACPNASGGLAGCDGIQNQMSVRLTSDSNANDWYVAQVGHDTDATEIGDKVTVQQHTGPSNASYRIRFGSNCDVTPGNIYRIAFYDIDNNGGDGAQANGKIKIRLRDITAGKWLRVTEDTNNAIGDWVGFEPVNEYVPPSNANATSYLRFEALGAGHKYVLSIMNAYQNNTIQFSTPFDGIYWVQRCQNPETNVRPDTSFSPAKSIYEAGEQVYARGSVVNTTSNAGYIDNLVRRAWFDGGNQSCCNADDSVLYNYSSTARRQVPGSNLVFGDLGPYEINGNYAYICTDVMNISADNSGNGGNPPVWTNVIAGNLGIGDDRTCVPIGKYPSMRVSGGDLRTGGQFANLGGICTATPTTNSSFSVIGHNYSSNTKGSFAEYGIISAGQILDFGANGVIGSSSGPVTGPNLMFGNRYHPSNTIDGLFYSATPTLALGTPLPSTHCLPDVYTSAVYPLSAPTTSGSASLDIDTTTAGEVRYHHQFTDSNQTLTINPTAAATLSDGQRRVLRITQTSPAFTGNRVVIGSNITYANSTYASASQLPFFALIADGSDVDIQVNNSVTGLEGLYATRGDFVTCNAGAVGGIRGTANSTEVGNGAWCNNALAINGAVMAAGRIYPYRTAGQNTASDNTPAEVFNLRGDLMISEYLRQSAASQVRTTHQEELPPRF